MLSKCTEEPKNWYRHVDKVRQIMNNTAPRSTKFSTFRLMTGVEMRREEYPDLKDIIDDDIKSELTDKQTSERVEAKRIFYNFKMKTEKYLIKYEFQNGTIK